MPFLFDLHLFLARPLKVGSQAGPQPDYANEVVLGAMPRMLLDDDVEWTRRQIESSSDLSDASGVMQNAYRMYYRSRGRAAAESYKRSKALIAEQSFAEPSPLLGKCHKAVYG